MGQDINEIKINENFKNTSLNRVLKKLKNKYDVRVSYDDALVSGVKVTGSYPDMNLSVFLDKILKNEGIDYQFLNGNLILVPRRIDLNISTPSLFDITVYGVIKDALTGESLPNALIRVDGDNSGTISNKDGYFTLVGVPTDTSTLEVRYLGYQNSKVKLKQGQTKQTMQVLMVESALELADFEVVDQVANTVSYGDNISQISINPKNLASLPNLGELDIFRSLQLLPGIGGTNETSSALNIRRSPSSHNLILLDGFNIYKLDHFFGVFSAINADAVRNIQVYKGGFGAKYGNRVSGVVDMTGSTGSFKDPFYSLGFNLLSARIGANLPINKGNGALHVSFRRAYTDIIRSNLFEKLYSNYREQSDQISGQQATSDVLRPDFKFNDLNIKSTYKVSPKDILSLSIYHGIDRLKSKYDVLNTDPQDPSQIIDVSSFNETGEWMNRGIGLIWSKNWNADYYSSLQVAQSDHYFDYFYEDTGLTNSGQVSRLYRLTRNNSIKDMQMNFSNELNIRERHRLNFGLNYSHLLVKNRAQIEDLNETEQTTIPPSEKGNITSIYLEDHFRLNSKIRLVPGIRMTYSDLNKTFYYAPRFALNYNITSHLELKGAFGKYIQLIREIPFDDPLSNVQGGYFLASKSKTDVYQIDALQSTHFIAGIQFSRNNLIIDLEYFNKDNQGLNEMLVSHLVDPLTNLRTPQVTFTRGQGTINGFDFLIQKKKKAYTGWLAYTYSQSQNTINDINQGEKLPSRLDQRHELKLVQLVDLSKWNFSATWTYGSGLPFLEPEIKLITDNNGDLINFEIINTTKTVTRLPDYHRLDLSAAMKFSNKELSGEVGISVLNVYNRQNIQGKRFKSDILEQIISNTPNIELPEDLYREVSLLDLTPSIFLNINF